MSIKVMSWVWEHSTARGSQHHVLLAIADCSSADGSNAYPSMSELTRKTRLSERTVQRAIEGLVKLGELFVSANDGPHGHNCYRVVMPTPAESAPPSNLHPRQIDTPVKLTPPPNSGKPARKPTNTPVKLTPRQIDTPADLTPITKYGGPPPYGGVTSYEPKNNFLSKIDSDEARPDVEALCQYLADKIVENGYRRPAITKQWRLDCRLMIDSEGREVPKIRKAIEWATADDFWRPNIRSMGKLRKHYDAMRDRAVQQQRREVERATGSRGPLLPPSNAPTVIPVAERCPKHPYHRKGACAECRAREFGAFDD